MGHTQYFFHWNSQHGIDLILIYFFQVYKVNIGDLAKAKWPSTKKEKKKD